MSAGGGRPRLKFDLIDAFDFVEDPKRWGYKFRFGLFEVNAHDMRLIAVALQADAQALGL